MNGHNQSQVRLVVDNTRPGHQRAYPSSTLPQLTTAHKRSTRSTTALNGNGIDWVLLNEQERRLIRLLRFTTYHGRNLVIQRAIAVRESHPWRDDPASFQTNIETSFPIEDRRFYSKTEGA